MVNYALASNTWDNSEIEAIDRVISSNQYTMGREVSEFEDQFAAQLSIKHAIMVNSGSSANLIACSALLNSERYRKGVVLVPAVSWSTTYFPLHQCGYKLRFIDIDPLTLNINSDLIEDSIDEDVVGICGVSLLGNPAGMDKISEIADRRKLFFYEDNCESFGALIGSKYAGTFGTITSHSFFFSHHLQTMEGGMVCTNDDRLAMIARSLRAHGWTRDKKSGDLSSDAVDDFHKSFEFVMPGYCVRPIEFMGAVGKEQLRKWPNMMGERRNNAAAFKRLMTKYSDIIRTQDEGQSTSSWFGFAMTLINAASGKRESLIQFFKKYEIEYRPIVAGNFTRQEVIRHINCEPPKHYPVADSIHFDGIFVGNDSRQLNKELAFLDLALSDFKASI
ncbi:DegT/DnrJ/EryC1/StrS aminotransferase family protein [Polynucleobacter sp. 80A-SIGWE]|uniref:DegT/DnrJ/EryC1/StrS family aminotransferase n=1 Tax=Polynucleobacter sp. 80A-SIGWE TaxID=2689100 RepID=UPI001C0C62E6|nr:DegT/DnrJ/EryC1/StrS family aminotransferase [Polynucleobacter sp. 80A-SIGWE]MBU3589076.1 DegT/DnrJ/EryC1/StrS family aminotransferase [Polynucleobacter sp. 80A-SIGWE]